MGKAWACLIVGGAMVAATIFVLATNTFLINFIISGIIILIAVSLIDAIYS
jgi:hypothetical protein